MVAGFLLAFCVAGLCAQTSGLRDRIVANHRVLTPSGPGPFPTVVAIPGCSGIAFPDPAEEASHPALREDDRLFRRHYPQAADRLRREGFAVLLIDVHGAEDLVTACRGEIPAERIARYIDDAVSWATELSFVDEGRIHVIGWSMGGGGVLAWLRGERSQWGTVRSAMAVYPDCSIGEPLESGVPLLMLLGGADDIASPSECEGLARRSGPQSPITVRTYPGARHGYDIADAPPLLDIGGGMTIGYQAAAAEATWREIVTFLAAASPGVGHVQCGATEGAIYGCLYGGPGPTIVLAAGAGQDSRTWAPILDELVAMGTVVTFDRPGLGRSPDVEGPRTPTAIAREMRDLLTSRGVSGPILLVGHSMGGIHVLRYAELFPESVAGVVLLDTPPPDFEGERMGLLSAREREQRSSALAEGRSRARPAVGRERDGAALETWDFDAFPATKPLFVVVADSQDFGELGSQELHRRLWTRLSRRWLDLSARSELVIASGSGHMIHQDRPRLVLEVIRRLVDAGRRPGSSEATAAHAQELRRLHEELLEAHRTGDVDRWMSIEAPEYVSANGGRVTFPEPSARRAQRAAYLESATFEAYRDVREPVVRVSADGSLGWLIAEVEVRGTVPSASGEPQAFHDVWAWVELYRNADGVWRLVGNASNRRPGA